MIEHNEHCLTLENPPAPAFLRAFFAITCLPLLCVGLLACYQLALAWFIPPQPPLENWQWLLGIGIALAFTTLPVMGLKLSLEPYKTLTLDTVKKQATLTKKYLHHTHTRHFAFNDIAAPEATYHSGQGDEFERWQLHWTLPDKTRMTYVPAGHSLHEQDNIVHQWRDTIIATLNP